jgi:hypothetical protein
VKLFLFAVANGLSFDGCVGLLDGRACLSSRLLTRIARCVS